MTTATIQPIKDFISEDAFTEWKAVIMAKAKMTLPEMMRALNHGRSNLNRVNQITHQIFSELQNVDQEIFKDSLVSILSLISEYSFQEKDFYLASQSTFATEKKDEIEINHLERSIDLNCDIWAQFLSGLHPMMFELARCAYNGGFTPNCIVNERFSNRRYQSTKFTFFNIEFNWRDSNKSENEHCLEVMPKLLKASEFDEENALAFLESVLQWQVFNQLQQKLITDLNKLIEENDSEKVDQPVTEFNINFLPSTQFELGLDGSEVQDFLKQLFSLISLTNITPTGETWSDEVIDFYNKNPSKNILLYNHFNVSVSKPNRTSLYAKRKLKVKYAK